ncbi:MAG: hypothetical protein AAFX94_11580 [Myxococcota bacterium]
MAETAAANGDHERAAAILGRGQASSGVFGPNGHLVPQANVADWGPLMLAGGLAVTDDLDRARRMAGLPEMGEAELAELEEEAREKWGDVIAMRTEGFQKVGFLVAQLGMLQLMPKLQTLPANQIAPAVKSIVDALEKIQGGVAPSFGPFNLAVKVVRRAKASG